MLSLPLFPPQEHPSTHLRSIFRPRPDSPPPAIQNNAATQQQRQQQQRRDEDRKNYSVRSPLALLAADEAAIAARKAAIRNFGAYWIRPPGVPKTLQAMHEEEQERVEQEEQARQERGLADLQAQQQANEARMQAEQGLADAEDAAEAGGERNLDDEIPEADAVAEVSWNEESMIDGSQLAEQREQEGDLEAEMEEAELTGAARDEEELGIERDLDDSVPQAGSYQHTDTEVEDNTSESDLLDSFAPQSSARPARSAQAQPLQTQVQGARGLQQRVLSQVATADGLTRSPGSLNLSSSLIESSFVGSSPVLQRGPQFGRARGARRRRGRQS